MDITPPTVTLDAGVDAVLQDATLGPGEHLFTGQVHDDRQASGLEVCVSPALRRYPYTVYLPLVMRGSDGSRYSTVVATSVAPDEPTCWPVNVWPGTTPTGTWAYAPATMQDADGEYQTVTFYGLDAVGNRSTVPLSRTYQVDTVPPAVTIITYVSEIPLEVYQPVTGTDKTTETVPPPVLVGTVSDGGSLSEVYVREDTPEGDSFWYVAERDGSTWSYTPRSKTAGLYTLPVEALDRAGNIHMTHDAVPRSRPQIEIRLYLITSLTLNPGCDKILPGSSDPFEAFLTTNRMRKTMAGQPGDETLVDQVQNGEWEAFEVLYQRYLPRVYNRLRALMPPEDVEDLTQEVFLAVLRSLNSFQKESAFSTWLYAIVNHKVSDYHRRGGKREDMERLFYEQEARLLSRDPQPRAEDRAVVRQVLLHLPEQYRDVILLRFAEGLAFKDIAKALDLSLEATKSLYRRAITAARKELVTKEV